MILNPKTERKISVECTETDGKKKQNTARGKKFRDHGTRKGHNGI